ncbi:MAG TPA: transposase [Candidatus Binatia bacterium]
MHHRRSLRLREYNYSRPGAYFVTICTQDRKCLFGSVVNGEMKPNDSARSAQSIWYDLPLRFPQVRLDQFVIMPNHIHAVIFVGAQFIAPTGFSNTVQTGAINLAPALGEIVRTYKAISSRTIRRTDCAQFKWQRNYYEHIIRDENSLHRIRQYIVDNPIRWDVDGENPAAITPEPKEAWR